MNQCIIGWGHTRFGRLTDETVESLIVKAASEALADAGVSGEEIDAIFVGNFNSGMNPQEFIASLVLQADPALRFKPCTRLENACASGSAAIHQGLNFLQAGLGKRVLVVGVEKMTDASAEQVARGLLGASYRPETAGLKAGFASVFANVADAYFARFGNREAALARIAAKNHRNGARNELAHLRKDLGFEFCNTVSDKNPLVDGRLKRSDCSPVSDGAAAIVIADQSVAGQARRAVRFRARAHTTDFLPMSRRDPVRFEAAELAWAQAFAQAGIGVGDLSFAEVHDCFTIAELMIYEAMGLTALGEGHVAIDEGWTEFDGRLPINPSGGLKAKGHPVGATGVSMHVMAAKQLVGEAGALQLPDPKLAAVFNMGGVAVANYTSILERWR